MAHEGTKSNSLPAVSEINGPTPLRAAQTLCKLYAIFCKYQCKTANICKQYTYQYESQDFHQVSQCTSLTQERYNIYIIYVYIYIYILVCDHGCFQTYAKHHKNINNENKAKNQEKTPKKTTSSITSWSFKGPRFFVPSPRKSHRLTFGVCLSQDETPVG